MTTVNLDLSTYLICKLTCAQNISNVSKLIISKVEKILFGVSLLKGGLQKQWMRLQQLQ